MEQEADKTGRRCRCMEQEADISGRRCRCIEQEAFKNKKLVRKSKAGSRNMYNLKVVCRKVKKLKKDKECMEEIKGGKTGVRIRKNRKQKKRMKGEWKGCKLNRVKNVCNMYVQVKIGERVYGTVRSDLRNSCKLRQKNGDQNRDMLKKVND